jgi:hypothetical protein
VEVPLYIGAAMGLDISCQLGGTCYRFFLVLASTTIVVHSSAEVVVVCVAVAKAIAWGFMLLLAKVF